VVVDLDGVLADASGRQHFLDGSRGTRDWDGFFDACGDDPYVGHMGALVALLDPALAVVVLTARPARVGAATLAWLGRHGVRWDLLGMRPDGDFRPAHAVKREHVEALQGVGFDVRLAIDDDPRNVAMFRSLGIAAVEVPSGYYGAG